MPKIVDKDQMRADILRAAQHVLLERGYHATRMSDIAAAAKLAKGTLYLYFKTKDALTSALITSHFMALEHGFLARPRPATLNALISDIETGLTIDTSHADTIRLFIETFGPGFTDSTVRTTTAAIFDRMGTRLAEDIAALQSAGQACSTISPAATGRALTAMLDGLLLHRGLFALTPDAYANMVCETRALLARALRP